MGNHSFAARNGIFGLLVGLGFIAAALIFYKTGQGISLNPGLNNAILLLSIVGAFIGVRKYREEELGGYISFGKAFGGCIYIIGVGTLVYGMYIYYMYGKHPELQEQYLLMVNTALDEVYKGNPMHDTLKSMMSGLVSPFFIAMAEVFNKIFTGFIFSLLLAGLLKRRKYVL